MKKQTIKLNENALRSIIRKSLERIYESKDYFSPEEYANSGEYGDPRIDDYEGGSLGDDYFSPEEYNGVDGRHMDGIPDFNEDDENLDFDGNNGMDECGCFNECGLNERRLDESISRNLKKILKNIR